MSKKQIAYIVGGIALIFSAYFFFNQKSETGDQEIIISPKVGDFEVTVTTSGELRAQKSQDISGPTSIRRARLGQLKIAALVDEGTLVEKGDFVAQIDISDIETKLTEAEINLQKYTSELTKTRLDCTLTLAKAREEIVNLRYNKEERKLEWEQSKYEPPATQRQAEIAYEKAGRAYDRDRENYITNVQKSTASMSIAQSDLAKEQSKYKDLLQIKSDFTILAPEKGMVIYHRSWDGKKRVAGSTFNSWNPLVATLPDLSVMESITFVNEVDIQKIRKGQVVELGLDADPKKKLKGKVTSIANVGEDLPNSDAKVYEVLILILVSDSTLRPAMTTSNVIMINKSKETLSVPLECIHSQDSISYVYKKEGMGTIKQEVILGLINDNEAEVITGLEPEDEIFQSIPFENDKIELTLLGNL